MAGGQDNVAALVAALGPVVSRVRTDVTAVKLDDGSRWTRDVLTPARLRAHVSGGKPRGVCPIREGEDTTQLALLDLDSHGGETPWPEMVEVAEALIETLAGEGLRAIPWRSSGGSGVHLFVVWDAPQDAYSVRAKLGDVLAVCGLKNGARGVADGEVEIFPKQDRIGSGEFGNQFILPLAGASVPLEPALGLEPMPRDYALALDWPASDPVPVREKPEAPTGGAVAADLATVRSALAAIPNEDEHDLDYDQWFQVLCALHSIDEGGPESHELAHEFSSRSGKYDAGFLDARVWPYIKADRERPVTVRTLYHLAGQHGWSPPAASADEFEALPVEADAEPALPGFVRDNKGRIEATIDNVVKAVSTSRMTGWRVAHDQFRDDLMLAPHGTDEWRPFQDHHYVDLRIVLERAGFKPVGRELIRDAVGKVAAERQFDSAMLWLETLAPGWDGVRRCGAFLPAYLGAEDTAYTRAVSRYIWSALAGRVLEPGVKADMMPILVGEQGARKTSAVEAMAPAPEHFVSIKLDKPEEELARAMRGALVAEVGELRGLHNRDHDSIKDWLSRRTEKWVPKYREFATTYPRRLLFIATTNNRQFLTDPTGNRRYPPVDVQAGDVDAIERDRDQLWAEAAHMFKTGGVDWEEAERLAKSVHHEYMIDDPWEEDIIAWLDAPADFADDDTRRGDEPFTMGDVMKGALGLRTDMKSNGHDKRVGAILRKLGFTRRKLRVHDRPVWAWTRANV